MQIKQISLSVTGDTDASERITSYSQSGTDYLKKAFEYFYKSIKLAIVTFVHRIILAVEKSLALINATSKYLVKQPMTILHSFTNLVKNRAEKREDYNQTLGSENRRRRFRLPRANYKKYVGVAVFIVIFLGGVYFMSSKLLTAQSTQSTPSSQKVEVMGARASVDVNKEFTFPLTDDSGEEVGGFKFLVQSAELRDEIIVDGKKATTIKGRTFLIINLKISNDFTQQVNINTKDYVRVSVNGNKDEWLAPDIHNDPVLVQAISTKFTRVGLPINTTDKDIILRVGEINGDKEEVPLVFN